MPSCNFLKPERLALGFVFALALLMCTSLARAGELEIAQRQWLAGQRPQALATVEAALVKSPDELKLRFALGVMRMELGEQDQALSIFTALTQDFPDLPDPYNNLAVVYAARGELGLAQRALEQALTLQPDHGQAQENLGDVLLRLALQAYQGAQRAQQVQSAPSSSGAMAHRRWRAAMLGATRRTPCLAMAAMLCSRSCHQSSL